MKQGPVSKLKRLKPWRLAQSMGLWSAFPGPVTPLPNLFLAGDWTDTGWPATMEGAVRSGYRAAEVVLRRCGVEARFVRPDLR